jgi:hypothetical protein
MLIKVRHITDAEAVYFTEGDLDTLNDLVQLFDSQGVYYERAGTEEECNGYQFVLTPTECFAEIIIGDETSWI